MDKYKVLFSENEIQSKIKEIADKINEDYKGQELCIICVLKGATPFCMDLIKRINLPLNLEFVRVSTYEGQTSSGKVKHLDMTLPSLVGKNVIVVEDIIDTGFTAKFLIDTLSSKNEAKSIKFAALLNKKEARKIDVDVDYFGFEIGNQYVIGYGLDSDGLYRNLPYIAVF